MPTTTALLTLTSDMTSDSTSVAPTFNLTTNGSTGHTLTSGLMTKTYSTVPLDKMGYMDWYKITWPTKPE